MSEQQPVPGASAPPPYCDFLPGYSAGFCYEATIQYGDNGPGPSPELSVNGVGGQYRWQFPPAPTFDSLAVPVEFAVHAGGGATLTVGGATASSNALRHEYVTGVQIGAAVIAVPQRLMQWDSILVKYYRRGAMWEMLTVPPECGPRADTYNGNTTAFQALARNPAASPYYDAVTVTAVLRLMGYRGDPSFEFGPADFYGKILVFTDTCRPR
jgi:hypothetical protein